MSAEVDALLAAHRPMSDPVAPDRLVICSCDAETSRDLIAHSRHLIEVGRGSALVVGPGKPAVLKARGQWPRRHLELEDRTEGAVRQRLRIVEGETSVRVDHLREAYVLDVGDLLKGLEVQAGKMADARQALS